MKKLLLTLIVLASLLSSCVSNKILTVNEAKEKAKEYTLSDQVYNLTAVLDSDGEMYAVRFYTDSGRTSCYIDAFTGEKLFADSEAYITPEKACDYVKIYIQNSAEAYTVENMSVTLTDGYDYKYYSVKTHSQGKTRVYDVDAFSGKILKMS